MNPTRYDWSLIIHKVKLFMHLTDVALADELHVDDSTVRNWIKRKTCPRYDEGAELVARYQRAFDEPPPTRKVALVIDPPEPLRPYRRGLCHPKTVEGTLTSEALTAAMGGGKRLHDPLPNAVHRMKK